MKGRLWGGLLVMVLGFSQAQVEGLEVQDSVVFPVFSDSVIAQRLEGLSADLPLCFHSKIRPFVDYFTIKDRAYTLKVMARAPRFFPMLSAALKQHGLPDELKYLAVIESGLNPKARSRMGAVGLWQFMPATGKRFGLSYDYYLDERMDPAQATEAACRYLKELYTTFQDWELALAAYNCGPGNVRRAIRRSGYKKGFWAIERYLPRETRSYVPQWLAIIYAMRHAEHHELVAEEVSDRAAEVLALLQDPCVVPVHQYVNLDLLAKALDVPVAVLVALNPMLKRKAVPAHYRDYPLRIPASKWTLFEGERVAILDHVKEKGAEALLAERSKVRIFYRVRRGDVLGSIAQRYHVRLSDLRMWNGIGRNNLIRVGQRLELYTQARYVAEGTPVGSHVPAQRKFKTGVVAPAEYKVQRGDTLWDISRKYKDLTIQKIKDLNHLKNSQLKIGQRLKLS